MPDVDSIKRDVERFLGSAMEANQLRAEVAAASADVARLHGTIRAAGEELNRIKAERDAARAEMEMHKENTNQVGLAFKHERGTRQRLEAEVERLRAENSALLRSMEHSATHRALNAMAAEVERLRESVQGTHALALAHDRLVAEVERLRAALEPSEEARRELASLMFTSSEPSLHGTAAEIFTWYRRRAGLEGGK